MSRRKTGILALLLALLLPLGGCISSLPQEKQATGQTLPEVRSGPEAPMGDSRASYTTSAILYVPDAEGTRLNATVAEVTVASGQTKQEAIVTRLLELVDASGFNAGTQQLRLMPLSNAVETTRDLATVNLHTSMRALSPMKQFALRMAIINTLTELSDTSYVNILVYGRDIGMDLEETVPTGVMPRYSGNDVATYWSQAQAQRAPGPDAELQKSAALYFVSSDGGSLLGEVRSITFHEQGAAAYARQLIEELSRGATRISGARVLVPEEDWFERDPVLVETDDGSYIELYFRGETDSFLAVRGSDYLMMLSSICYTLTSFIPKLEGIISYVGGERLTSLTRTGETETWWTMQNGQMTRESVSALAADVCTLYYPLDSGEGLYAVNRPIAQRLRSQPRALLRELMKPPEHPSLARALPETITDADILGLQIQDDTALINVSAAFARACADMSATQERNMIYAIVNTLTEMEGVKRVRIFVEGTQSPLAGHMAIGGEFMRNTGLIYTGSI